jgi:hypothetical protein
MIWICSLGIHKQFRRETWTAISWIIQEIANNDIGQLTKFGKSDLHSFTKLYFNKVHSVLYSLAHGQVNVRF